MSARPAAHLGSLGFKGSVAGGQFIEEAERSLHDAIMIVRRAVKNATVVAGGGAIDVRGRVRWQSIRGGEVADMGVVADGSFPVLTATCTDHCWEGAAVHQRLR